MTPPVRTEPARCAWTGRTALLCDYHDAEWGIPERDSRALWEKLVLDGFQAGLAWVTVLRKRDAFRRAFAGFDPVRVAAFTAADVDRLLGDAGIIRSRSKIEAAIGNARAFLAMQAAGEDFSAFVWSFVGGAPLRGDGTARVVRSPESEALSKALKQRGFKFVGPVIVYAWMQATGLLDDHDAACFRSTGEPA